MLKLTLLALTLPASATTIVFQEDVRGGVAVDASAVDASATGSSSLASGPAFQITIPTTATVTEAFLILMAKPDGFLDTESAVRVNGFDLSFGTLMSATDVAEVYSLPPTVYGITSTGPVSYQEEGSAEDDFHFGPGIVGATQSAAAS